MSVHQFYPNRRGLFGASKGRWGGTPLSPPPTGSKPQSRNYEIAPIFMICYLSQHGLTGIFLCNKYQFEFYFLLSDVLLADSNIYFIWYVLTRTCFT